MKRNFFSLALLLLGPLLLAQPQQVSVTQTEAGVKLVVDHSDFMINGMNWDYYPIGTNYTYSLWAQPDSLIKAALETEMTLLQHMGVNAIRQYTGVPARWITYIYEEYGIYTMLNHSFGRYGLSIDGNWVAHTEYEDAKVAEILLSEVKKLAADYKNTRGLLLYLLGNENNYGLFWEGAETEDIPTEDRASTQRAQAMYELFNEAALAMKALDSHHPVALCNGDLQFIDLIAASCGDIDIFGTNMYRGLSFTDAFEEVKTKLNKPLLFTEFGADAYNALQQTEEQGPQAYYMVGNWQEIYENAAGQGKAENCIGGFTFQFSDGWWKFGQTTHLDIHDNNASWANGGYRFDYQEGSNNMNEEWFGICAKGPTDTRGLYELYPRAAYYALQQVHKIDPYAKAVNPATLKRHFSRIKLKKAIRKARKYRRLSK